jgi:hypothetical protein
VNRSYPFTPDASYEINVRGPVLGVPSDIVVCVELVLVRLEQFLIPLPFRDAPRDIFVRDIVGVALHRKKCAKAVLQEFGPTLVHEELSAQERGRYWRHEVIE